MTIIFIILMLSVSIGIIYFLYDYINYKDDIDTSFTKLNTSVNTVESTVTNKVKKYDEQINNMDTQHNNMITDIATSKTYMSNLENNLKHYLKFNDNNNAEQNRKIFEHAFTAVEPNLEILAKTTAVNGLTANTSTETIHHKNFKICNSENKCMHMNIDANNVFNITPDNISSFVVNSKNQQPFTKYDFDNNSVYFGGTDMNNSPMFMSDGELYLNRFNIIKKEKDSLLNKDNLRENSIKYDSVETYQDVKDILHDIELFKKNIGGAFTNLMKYYYKFMENNEEWLKLVSNYFSQLFEQSMIAQYILHVHYSVLNEMVNIDRQRLSDNYSRDISETTNVIVNKISIQVISKIKINKNDIINIYLPESVFGKISNEKGTVDMKENLDKKYFIKFSENISVTNYEIQPGNLLVFTIDDIKQTNMDNAFNKNDVINISIKGINIFEKSTNSSFNGISLGVLDITNNFENVKINTDIEIENPYTPNFEYKSDLSENLFYLYNNDDRQPKTTYDIEPPMEYKFDTQPPQQHEKL